MADLLGLQQGGPDTTGMSFETDTAQDRAAALQAHNSNVTMSLLAAGLAALASRARRPSEALGRAGLTGLENYETGESTIAKQQQAERQLRATNAYRAADIGLKGQIAQGTQDYRNKIIGVREDDTKEKTRHDTVMEGEGQEQRDIAAKNADINAERAGIDATRVQLEGVRNQIAEQNVGINKAKAMAEIAPGAVDTLAGFRGTAVEKAIPGMPDAKSVMAMPSKYSYALQKDIINTYARMKTDKTYSPHWAKMADNHWHKFWTDSTGDHDKDMGPAAVTTGVDYTDPTKNSAVTGESPAATPAATPSAAPSNMPPPATPAANLGTAPKQFWGKRVRLGGTTYDIDANGNPTPVGAPAAAPGGL